MIVTNVRMSCVVAVLRQALKLDVFDELVDLMVPPVDR